MKNVTFLTYANSKYHHFVLPYIFSILKYTDANIEIRMPDTLFFFEKYGKQLSNIKHIFGKGKLVSVTDSTTCNGIIPNTIRFLEWPFTQSKYTYITDVDMIIIKDQYEKALENNINGMKKNKTCFFNFVRPQGGRLSGIHFVNTREYYAKIDNYIIKIKNLRHEIINRQGDEGFLYNMINDVFGKPEDLTKNNKRILPGWHLSPNRNQKYTHIINELGKDDDWKYAFTQFSDKFMES